MYCANCGAKLSDNVSFCEQCGCPIENSQTASAGPGFAKVGMKSNASKTIRNEMMPKKEIRFSSTLIVVCVGIVVLMIGGIVAYGCYNSHKATDIDLTSVMAVPYFSGYDGDGYVEEIFVDETRIPGNENGSVYVPYDPDDDIDTDEYEDEYDEYDDYDDYDDSTDTQSDKQSFWESVYYDASPFDGLSNGDEITVTAQYDEKLAEAAGYNITNTTCTVKVSDLIEILSKETVSKDNLNTLKARAEKRIRNEYDPDDYIDLTPTCIASYVVTSETDDEYYDETDEYTAYQSHISLLYKVDYKAHDWSGDISDETMFIEVSTEDVYDDQIDYKRVDLGISEYYDTKSSKGMIRKFEEYVTDYDATLDRLD